MQKTVRIGVSMTAVEGAEVHSIYAEGEPPRAGLHRKKFGGRRKDGRLVLYDDPALAAARVFWETAVLRCGKKNLNLTGPLGLRIVLVFPHPKCSLKRKAGQYELRDKAPDSSNIVKVIEDVLQSMGVVCNDSQFASTMVTRLTGPEPCALIELMRLEPSVQVAVREA